MTLYDVVLHLTSTENMEGTWNKKLFFTKMTIITASGQSNLICTGAEEKFVVTKKSVNKGDDCDLPP